MEKQNQESRKTNPWKVGILTYHDADNYGAVLQAFSLKSVISAWGVDVNIIDFVTAEEEKSHRVFRRYYDSVLKNCIANLLLIPNYRRIKRRISNFASFRNEHLALSKRYRTRDELIASMANRDFSDIISGSDQVFNVDVSAPPSMYYLPFDMPGVNKIAYAPSFGFSEFTEDIDKIISKPLKNFSFLSCREVDGANHITKLTRNKCSVVLDPVFLNNSAFWSRMAQEPTVDGDYILVYDLLGGINLIELARKLKLRRNPQLKIVCLTTKKFLKIDYRADYMVWDASPMQFVGYFKKASYVVTDSFHGTAFSLIFNKPLVSMVISERAKSRLYTILSKINSETKIVPKNSNVIDVEMENHIIENYDSSIIESEREFSMSFLHSALFNK